MAIIKLVKTDQVPEHMKQKMAKKINLETNYWKKNS